MCFWKAYCPIAGKIILIILVGNGRRFVYCVWLCFGNIMSVATINNVHSHKFQWNFFFWRKWVVVDNIILIKIFWVLYYHQKLILDYCLPTWFLVFLVALRGVLSAKMIFQMSFRIWVKTLLMRKVVFFFGVFSRVKREGKNRQFNSSTQNFNINLIKVTKLWHLLFHRILKNCFEAIYIHISITKYSKIAEMNGIIGVK